MPVDIGARSSSLFTIIDSPSRYTDAAAQPTASFSWAPDTKALPHAASIRRRPGLAFGEVSELQPFKNAP
jgi:hypothetical protein